MLLDDMSTDLPAIELLRMSKHTLLLGIHTAIERSP